MLRTLKIFADKSYLQSGGMHVVMLAPFWGKHPEDPGDPACGRFDRYLEMGTRIFRMTTLEDADVAVFPGGWENVLGNPDAMRRAERLLEEAGRVGKPVVVFFCSDMDEDVRHKGTVVFRTSLYRSRKPPNVFAMPAWSEDFAAKYFGGQLPVRPKRARGIVGFCGCPHTSETRPPGRGMKRLLSASRRWARRLRLTAPRSVRKLALQALARSPGIDTNFLLRERFWGGAQLPSGRLDTIQMQVARREYVQNMLESDYILCTRGAGNFSYRLYETLSCGRIPVFVDTDSVLPFHSHIEWKDYGVWVDEKDIPHIGERVAAFHESLSPGRYADLQHCCRRLWEDYLSPEGFFQNLYRHL